MKNRSRILIFASFLFCFLLNTSVFARSSTNYIGKVNLQALVLFHPLMIGYDPQKRAFKVDVRHISKEAQKRKMSSNLSKLRALKAEKRRLVAKAVAVNREYDRKLQSLSNRYLEKATKMATGARDMNRVLYKNEEERAALKHRSQTFSISTKLQNIDDEIMSLSNLQIAPGYSSPEETEKKIGQIIVEIRKYTKQIAAQKGIQIVLNSGASVKSMSRTAQSVIPSDLYYSKIFSNPFPKSLLNDSQAVRGYYSTVQSISYNWLIHGEQILEPFQASLKNTEVFIGGVDLTADVLSSIFRAYKIDKNLSNVIVQTVSSF